MPRRQLAPRLPASVTWPLVVFFGDAAAAHAFRVVRWLRRRCVFVFVSLIFPHIVMSGCVPDGGDPLRVVLSRERDGSQRIAALHKLRARGDADPAALASMESILWSDREPVSLRLAMVDHLAQLAPGRLESSMAQRLHQVQDLAVLQKLLDWAVEQDDVDLTLPIIRSLARPAPASAEPRPEVAALLSLYPDQTLRGLLFREVAEGTSGFVGRAAAWTVLARTENGSTLRRWLAEAREGDRFIRDLQAAAEVLDDLPASPEALLWLRSLRSREGGAGWREASRAVGRLTAEQRHGLELRHLPVLALLDGSLDALDTRHLRDRIGLHLSAATPTARVEQGTMGPLPPEAYAHWQDRLPWPDLATLHLLLEALEDRSVVVAWFRQADADFEDRLSEHGGVLQVDGEGRLVARAFEPQLRLHDRKFYAPEELIEAIHFGVAHYHFHAQQHDHAAFAGPGAGDLAFADRHGPNALVLTFLDRETMNVDFYRSGGIVVDLGIIQRDGSR